MLGNDLLLDLAHPPRELGAIDDRVIDEPHVVVLLLAARRCNRIEAAACHLYTVLQRPAYTSHKTFLGAEVISQLCELLNVQALAFVREVHSDDGIELVGVSSSHRVTRLR